MKPKYTDFRPGDRVAYRKGDSSTGYKELRWGTVISPDEWLAYVNGIRPERHYDLMSEDAEPIYVHWDGRGNDIGWMMGKSLSAWERRRSVCAECEAEIEWDDYLCSACRSTILST